jgi:hypothetical protein
MPGRRSRCHADGPHRSSTAPGTWFSTPEPATDVSNADVSCRRSAESGSTRSRTPASPAAPSDRRYRLPAGPPTPPGRRRRPPCSCRLLRRASPARLGVVRQATCWLAPSAKRGPVTGQRTRPAGVARDPQWNSHSQIGAHAVGAWCGSQADSAGSVPVTRSLRRWRPLVMAASASLDSTSTARADSARCMGIGLVFTEGQPNGSSSEKLGLNVATRCPSRSSRVNVTLDGPSLATGIST